MIQAIQVLLVCVFTAMLGLGIVSPIMPLYAESLGATFVQIGLLSSAWSISRLVFTPPAGRLADKRSKRIIIAGGLATYMVVSILYTFAWDFPSLVSMRFLHGLGSAMSMPIAYAYAAELAPEGKEGRYMGTMNMAMFAGMGMGPFIGGYLTDAFSLSAPFYVMSAMTALSLLLTLLLLPEEKRRTTAERRPSPSFRKVLSNKLLRAAFIYRAVGALGRGSIIGFLSIFISGSPEIGGLGLPVSMAGLILSVGQVSTAVLQRPFGDLADRYSKVRLILIGGALGAVGYALLPNAHTAWEVMIARLVVSAGGAMGMPALTAIVTIEGRELGMGTTMSVLQSAMSIGMIVGPLLSGIIVDLIGLNMVFYVGGLISLAGTAAFYLVHRLH